MRRICLVWALVAWGCGSSGPGNSPVDADTDAAPTDVGVRDSGLEDTGAPDTGASCTDEDGDGFSTDCGELRDCDDDDASTYPTAPEACDGVDHDCDGSVDPACACIDGESRDCGPEAEVGECVLGAQTCDGETWGACLGAVLEAVEVCNDLDDDCDGVSDEGALTTYYRDVDMDGAGDASDSTDACDAPTGYVSDDSDCDDTVASTHPDAAETCDGVDNDCDGSIDPGCACLDGETQRCGPVSEVGECVFGIETCEGDSWGSCVAATVGVDELCNGLDDDCDGVTDEGVLLTFYRDADMDGSGDATDSMSACVAPPGYVPDALDCDDTAPTTHPGATEVCDGFDNDCDGSTDPGCACIDGTARGCGSDEGTCVAGTETCASGAWGSCAGETASGTETCDGALDEDCDAIIDEGCACVNGANRACGEDTGICVAGTEACASGAWGSCVGRTGPGTEVCDGALDEDCDGVVDEGCACVDGSVRGCGDDTGICVAGTQACTSGAWGGCEGSVGPGAEVCDGMLDEDCDGMVDEGCACVNGAMRACGDDTGACVAGTQLCATGAWGACGGAVGPGAEVCDGGLDEDCDGVVDEGCLCVDGTTRPCGRDLGACMRGTETCGGGAWGSCSLSTGPSAELCEGTVDEDCDGRVDEGCGNACGWCPVGATCGPSGFCVGVDLSGLVLDVPTIEVSGFVTRNGATPTATAGCSGPTDDGATVTFIEETYGYTFSTSAFCGRGFVFDATTLFPGTYTVKVRGDTADSNIPGTTYNSITGLELSADTTDLVVDVPTIEVSGLVTRNGATPTATAGCSGPTDDGATVTFVEEMFGYTFSTSAFCGRGFVFDATTLFPGTYTVQVRGDTADSNIPGTTYFAITGLSLSADTTDLVVDVPTLFVSGRVTRNGLLPTATAGCSGTTDDGATVTFEELTFGYTFSTSAFCGLEFTFGPVQIYPGVYEARVRGDTADSNIPGTDYVSIGRIELR